MNINFGHKRLMCFFFYMYKIVFYLEQIVGKDMLTAWLYTKKNADFMKLKVTKGNQAFFGWRDQDTTFIYLHHLAFCIIGSGLFVQPVYCTAVRCKDPQIVFFRKVMVAAQNLLIGNGLRNLTTNRCSFKHYGRLPEAVKRKNENKKEELSVKNWKTNSPGCILMSLNKQCFEPIHP